MSEHQCNEFDCTVCVVYPLQARIDELEKELAPLEGRSVLDTVKYVAHLESRVMELVNICAEYDVPEEALLEAEK